MDIDPTALAGAGDDLVRHSGTLHGLDRFLHDTFTSAGQAAGHPDVVETAERAGQHWSGTGADVHAAVHVLGQGVRGAGAGYVDLDDAVSVRLARSIRTTT